MPIRDMPDDATADVITPVGGAQAHLPAMGAKDQAQDG
jgi:hypothetical protein